MHIIETIKTEITEQYDVAVCGGGIAGIAAALAAAREGKKVVLIEKQFMLGGLATAGLITIYLPLCDGKGRQVSFGLAEELLRLSITYGFPLPMAQKIYIPKIGWTARVQEVKKTNALRYNITHSCLPFWQSRS